MKNFSKIKEYLSLYLAHRPFFLSLIRAKEAELFARYMPLSHPVLDVGCGDGFFASTVFHTLDVGLDVENSRVDQAKLQDVYRSIQTYDGKRMPFPSRKFATVISNCVLEHIPNLDEVTKEMYRVLKPGGSCIVSVMAKPWEDNLFGSLIMGNSYTQWMQKKQMHINVYTSEQWSEVFHSAGFRIEKQIGYLSPAACRFIDIAHYLSLPSLLSYVLWKKWVLFSYLSRIYPIERLSRIIGPDVDSKISGAIFFVLRK